MTISKRLLGVSGIWPLKIRNSLFISFAIYGCVFNILALLDLIKYIKDFRYVMANVMENIGIDDGDKNLNVTNKVSYVVTVSDRDQSGLHS